MDASPDATGSDYLLDALAAEGLDTLFGVIGEGNSHLIDRMNDHDIQFTQARHEQAAVSMADGQARTRHSVAVCTVTHGPGLTNAATGIAAADRDNVPLVVLVGDTAIAGREQSLQYLDHRTFAEPVSVSQMRIEATATLPERLKRAFDRARTRSGPVVIEIPTDIQIGPSPEKPYSPISRPRQRIRPDERHIAEAVSLIDSARHPIVLAGGGANRSDAGAELEAFATHVGAPIATTYFGRGVLPDGHPMVSGIAGTFMTPANDELLREADVAVVAGATLSGKVTRYGELYADTDVIQIDIDEESLATHQGPAVGIIGDAAATLAVLAEQTKENHERADRISEAIAKAPTPWADGFEERSDEIDPREFTRELSDRVPDDSIITVGAGNNTGFPALFHEVGAGGEMIVNGNFGAMGHSLPAALGAKVASPDRTVVCYTGDGELLQVIQEIETGVRLEIPIVIAVFNDRSYGIIRHRQNLEFERETASSYDSSNLVRIAEGFGAHAECIRDSGDLSVVDNYLESDPDVPLLLDARTIPEVSRPGFPPY